MVAAGPGSSPAGTRAAAATMADAYARTSGRASCADRAPGVRPHQCDDRNHRGGQDPDAARRGHRRGRRNCGPTSTLTRRARCGGPRRGATRDVRRDRVGRHGRRAAAAVHQRATVVLNLPLESRRASRRTDVAGPVERRPHAAHPLAARSSDWRPRCRRVEAGLRRRPRRGLHAARDAIVALGERSGALLATSAVARASSSASRSRWTCRAGSPRRWQPS